MSQHFDDETGEPKEATRMASWPYHALMIKAKLPGEHFKRSILVSSSRMMPDSRGRLVLVFMY